MSVVIQFAGYPTFKRLHFQKEYSERSGQVLAAAFSTLLISGVSFFQIVRENHLASENWIIILTSSIQIFLFTFSFLGMSLYFFYVYISLIKSATLTQADRNLYADNIVTNAGRNRNNTYSLYLRPFILDNLIRNNSSFKSDDRFIRLINDSFENLLAMAIDKEFPIVSIGGAHSSFGPGGHALKDDDWKDRILHLMDEAKLIFIVPIAQPSTLWEIEKIKSKGLLRKTIFIVPPMMSTILKKESIIGSNKMAKDLYYHSHDEIKKIGITLPKLDESGGIFWYYGKDNIDWRVRIFVNNKNISLKILRSILEESKNLSISSDEVFYNDPENLPIQTIKSQFQEKNKEKNWSKIIRWGVYFYSVMGIIYLLLCIVDYLLN